MRPAIVFGSEVTLHFTLSLEDGTLVDHAEKNEPMVVTIGKSGMVEGLDHALVGLRAGDNQKLVIPPESGFGYPDAAAIQWMDISEFPDDMSLKQGQIIGFQLPDGSEVPGSIKQITKDKVEVDLNHPLSGHDVTFEVTILKVKIPNL